MTEAYKHILKAVQEGTISDVAPADIDELMRRQLELLDDPMAREALLNHSLLHTFSVIGSFSPSHGVLAAHAALFTAQSLNRNSVSDKSGV